jgi:hypothetical protein
VGKNHWKKWFLAKPLEEINILYILVA